MNYSPHREHGAALLVALMFLIILTLLSVHAMRSSTMELRLASNEQEQRIGFDSSRSALTAAMNSSGLTITSVGDVSCFGFDTTPHCTGTAVMLNAGAGTGPENTVVALLEQIAQCPRSSEMSITGTEGERDTGDGASGQCAFFRVDSIYDARDHRGGRVETREGYIISVPGGY